MTSPVSDVIDYVLILALRLCSSASVIYSLLPTKKEKKDTFPMLYFDTIFSFGLMF